ncbi:MAG: cyclic nucleotide-binding domain-containing protein [Alphaproteobacteria bacterium]|nr:cyclic nucleotide-binding domain-containing protein [Alphaproteobacteria bacterium]MBF0250690.1 cyclic nucleotide-binding domain-containing protein [Alphaproteobacteria bacterium]
MMKRGIIVPVERSGVTLETGPNAILLSDLMVQSGQLSNMAEFPVLQMLYRQGMGIPNHPGNCGVKPLLIGSAGQVSAQLDYIHRGNYGLVSEDEMRAAGADAGLARQLMREKLRFAFGAIHESRDLVDTLAVDTETVNIRGGATVRRDGLNHFEFTYGGEIVSVDLNLRPGELYPSPYPLGVNDTPREYFAVLHSGEGDGWDINRPSMSSIILFQGRPYLIDAGANIDYSLEALGIGVNEIEGIFHTHCHDDHFAGLVNLIRADHKVKYFATPLVRASVQKKISALLGIAEDAFADYFDVHDLTLGEWNDLGGLEARPILSPHPVETSIFEFRALGPDGYRTYAHFADIAGFSVLDGMVTDDDAAPGIGADRARAVKNAYLAPATVKKLDVGGGMIHGDAEDFRDDASGKILLAHTAHPFTDRQKEIGSGAPYGTMDILIPSHQEYTRRNAFVLLHDYFQDVANERLQVLLNNEIVTFNPETIILREGHAAQDVYLVLSGALDVISTATGVSSRVSTGSLVGEQSALHGLPSMATYRARSFVSALRLPTAQYLEFVTRNDQYAEISRLDEYKEFLQRIWLFNEALSDTVQNRIARDLEIRAFAPDEHVPVADGTSLWLVRDGRVEWEWGREFGPGEFFGEGRALFAEETDDGYTATEHSHLYRVPFKTLEDIPIIRWKLFESHQRHKLLM